MAQRTYTKTMFHRNLEEAKVLLYIYDTCKYTDDFHYSPEERTEVNYTGLTSWTVVEGGKEAEEIEAHTDCIDEFHEYLILRFANGETATFRNSHVTLFII